VKKERVYAVIKLAYDTMRDFGLENPRIGVAGLNPHASDGGLFGCEETEEIAPAIAKARAEGMIVDGPVPPDTLYSKALGGLYDIVVAMYHDQGHIPLKIVGFHMERHRETDRWKLSVSGVNITLGIYHNSAPRWITGTALIGKAARNGLSRKAFLNAIDYAVQFPTAHSEENGRKKEGESQMKKLTTFSSPCQPPSGSDESVGFRAPSRPQAKRPAGCGHGPFHLRY
jgi:4-hydroxythreonine-4-phosphate dehydrogenase